MAEKQSAPQGQQEPVKRVATPHKGCIVILINSANGSPVGVLDAAKKLFMVLPGAEKPSGAVAKHCKTDTAKHDVVPSFYLSRTKAVHDQTLMDNLVKGSKEYNCVMLEMSVVSDEA